MILTLLDALAATASIKEKQAILEANKDNDLLKEIFRITYTKQIMFYIKQFPTEFDVYRSPPHSLEWAIEGLKELSERRVTGHAARDHLRKVASLINERDREVLRRIINRDLECGAGVTLPNRVWEKLIPEQPQCLATAYSKKALQRIRYPAYSQLKADGSRCFADLVADKEIRKCTRAGNEYTGLVDIDESLDKIRKILGEDFVIDGEMIYVNKLVNKVTFDAPTLDDFFDEPLTPKQDEQAETTRKESNGIVNKSLKGTITVKEQQSVVYQVWDLVHYDVYYGDQPCEIGYRDRLNRLESAILQAGVSNVQVVPTLLVHNFDQAWADYKKYRLDGKEGSIVKNIDFMWKDARVADQVKIKNKQPIDLKIIDIYEHKKESNKAGGFVVVDLSGECQVNTGSGMKDTTHRKNKKTKELEYIPLTIDERGDLDREFIMANKDMYIGAIVEMEVDSLMTSESRKNGEPEFSLFLPIIKKMRFDKTQPNDIHDIFADYFTK